MPAGPRASCITTLLTGGGAMGSRHALRIALVAMSLGFAGHAMATEGALGRDVTGTGITPYIGIIPPEAGLKVSLSYVNYDGSIGGARSVPIGGVAAVNLHAKIDLYAATFAYVWDTGPGRWNFASMATIPYIRPNATADLSLGRLGGRTSDNASGLFDLYFAPVIASYHVSAVEHWSVGMYVYAPTADYEKGRLANKGLNVWTYSPAVGYTHLFSKGTFEVSALAGVDFYSRNHATDYKNGEMFRLDALAMQRTASGFGFGAAFGWQQQLKDDSGPTADRLDGFRGHAVAAGPALAYKKAWDKETSVDVTFRWLKEFDVKNRIKGEPLVLNVALAF
jgi:hypothetical protein